MLGGKRIKDRRVTEEAYGHSFLDLTQVMWVSIALSYSGDNFIVYLE